MTRSVHLLNLPNAWTKIVYASAAANNQFFRLNAAVAKVEKRRKTADEVSMKRKSIRSKGCSSCVALVTLFVSVISIFQAAAAPFTDANWSAVGTGLEGGQDGPHCDLSFAYALAIMGKDLFVGGEFTNASGVDANYIAKWDGTDWSPLGEGLDASVNSLAVAGTDLYACGYFHEAGGIPAAGIAKWNGTNWSAIGSGFVGVGNALIPLTMTISGTNLYVGGSFTTVGGIAARNVAKWDGASWSAVGAGLGGTVSALLASGNYLYAGGDFDDFANNATRRVAKWDGTNWSFLGSGLGSPGVVVYGAPASSLAIVGNDLYAGGIFSTNSGSPVNFIARWNGSTWSAVGPGLGSDGGVTALAVSGSDVYVAGYLLFGGSLGHHLLEWNGTRWSELGSGFGQFGYGVFALAQSGSDLYAAGGFSMAGGKPAASIAHAYLERPALSHVRVGGNVKLSWPSFYGDFVLQQSAEAVNSGNWSISSYSLSTNASTIAATVSPGASNRFFRLIEQ